MLNFYRTHTFIYKVASLLTMILCPNKPITCKLATWFVMENQSLTFPSHGGLRGETLRGCPELPENALPHTATLEKDQHSLSKV
jgi:hypothetical protein